MKRNILLPVFLALAVAAAPVLASPTPQSVAPPTPSTESNGTPEARAFFEQGEAALKEGQGYAKAAELFRKAIGADPRFVEAHSRFLFATRQAAFNYDEKTGKGNKEAAERAEAELSQLYEGWAKAHPDNAVYEWALGKSQGKDWAAAERHYQRAIAIDPSFARVYHELALLADFRGENQKQVDYLKKAADLNPKDPQYLFYYASAMKRIDPERSRKLLAEVADRHPGTERGAQGLYWAGFEATDPREKVAIYERLRREFPPEKFGWSASAMSALFERYSKTAPDKALALAEDMLKRLTSKSGQKTWEGCLYYQRALVEARSLLEKGQAAAAATRLDAVPRPRFLDVATLDLTKAEALDASGNAAKAYMNLVTLAAKEPSDALNAAVTKYATKLGKTPADVSADIWKLREADAKPAPAFALPDYPDGKRVNLSDHRGKVVLVNFWYPSCGPCRGEFPTLQRVLDKYKDRGFTILALNVLPEEDAFVMPYLKNNGFTFRALKTGTDWAEKNYGARGFPSNHLVDAQGRVIFKPGVIRGEDEQRRFELQVEALLERAQGGR